MYIYTHIDIGNACLVLSELDESGGVTGGGARLPSFFRKLSMSVCVCVCVSVCVCVCVCE